MSLDSFLEANPQFKNYPRGEVETYLNNYKSKQQQQPEQPQQQPQQKQPEQRSLLSSIGHIPQDILGYGKQVASEAGDFGGQVRHDPMRVLLNMGAASGQMAQDVANLPYHLTQALSKKAARFVPHVQEVDINKMLGVSDYKKGDIISRSLMMALFPEFKGAGAVGKIGQTAARAGEGALYGGAPIIAQGDPNQALAAIVGAAAIPKAIEAPAAAIRRAKSLPSRIARGTATPEELSRNLQVAGDLPVNLGAITKSPTIDKSYANLLANMPGSGVASQYKRVGEGLQTKGEELLGDITDSHISGDPNDLVKSMLGQAHQSARNIKNNLYNKVNDIAKSENHQLDLSSFKDKVSENYDYLKDSLLVKSDPSVKSFLNKMSSISDKGALSKGVDITEANLVKNKLYNMGQDLSKFHAPASDRLLGNMYKDLSSSIGKDIKNSIDKTGSNELKSAFEGATKNYAKNYAGFLDKDLWKFLDPSKNADSIVHDIINPSKIKDKHTQISKIQSLLPQDSKNLLGHTFLLNATDKSGNITPSSISTKLNKLGPRQFKALFPEKSTRDKISDFQNLKNISGDALKYMSNEPTGKTNLTKFAPLIEGGAAGIGASIAGLPGVLAGLAAPAIASNLSAKYLTSPKVRQKLVGQMLERESGKARKKTKADSLANALAKIYARKPSSQGEQ